MLTEKNCACRMCCKFMFQHHCDFFFRFPLKFKQQLRTPSRKLFSNDIELCEIFLKLKCILYCFIKIPTGHLKTNRYLHTHSHNRHHSPSFSFFFLKKWTTFNLCLLHVTWHWIIMATVETTLMHEQNIRATFCVKYPEKQRRIEKHHNV